MGHRVIVSSADTGSTVSGGSTVRFPPSGNLWRDRDVTGLKDVVVMASLSASANYSMVLRASFTDPSATGSVFKGQREVFTPDGGLAASNSNTVAFRSNGPHMHFSHLNIINGSATADLTVEQLGVIWESNNG